tara:strand:+ start:61101 stop:61892 length:792 start_codon:yes stop_codon:yes gene_type:complete
MISFNQNLKSNIYSKKSLLCVGIDIAPENIQSNNIKDLIDHSKIVIDATRNLAIAYKPNFAFFERWGSEGFRWLEEILEYIGYSHIKIADAKRGDIGNTAYQYACSIFDHFKFDAVTLNPYLGRDSIEPFIGNPGKGVFILCRTSNNSASDFQNEEIGNQLLYEKVAIWADSMNSNDNVGLVVGATALEEIIKIRKVTPNLPLLIPGVGAQGGSLEHSVKEGSITGTALVNISRAISFAGNMTKQDIHDAAKNYVDAMNKALR